MTGGDAFTATLAHSGGDARAVASVEDRGDGTYRCTYVVERAGVWTCAVEVDGEPVADSPYLVRVAPGAPSPRATTVAGDGRSFAHAGRPAAARVEPRDRFGNRCLPEQVRGLGRVEASLVRDGATSVAPDVSCADDGSLRLTYVAPEPGWYRLTVTAGGEPLAGCPFSVCVQPPGTVAGGEGDTAPAPGASAGAAGAAAADAAEAAAAEVAALRLAGASGAGGGAGPGVDDVVGRWARIAESEFAFDGDAAGWDSADDGDRLPAHERYRREHPGVPVVENMEDMWMLTKYQVSRGRRRRRAAQGGGRGRRGRRRPAGPPRRPRGPCPQNEVKEREREAAEARAEARRARREGMRRALGAKYGAPVPPA